MRTPVEQIADALNMFYEGLSLNSIRRQLNQTYGYTPSDSTVYEWIIRFTKNVLSVFDSYKARTGNTWLADETVLKIGGKNIWFWDVIDYSTRFLLSSHLSIARATKDAQTLMINALEHSTNIPSRIITDKLRAYIDGIEVVFGAYTKHIPSRGFVSEDNINLIERFHGTLKDRVKVMRGMKNKATAKLIMDGWLVHYNFFRPHEALNGETPAKRAGIFYKLKNWFDVVNRGQF